MIRRTFLKSLFGTAVALPAAGAVAVRRRGCKLGYIPGKDNCTAAQLLDRGQPVSARITAPQMSDDPWERIQMAIVL